jgi:dienelactone hydrolase
VIRVTPAVGLYDVSRSIAVSNLEPGEVVTVSATTPRPDGVWTARASYAADRAGVVDVSRSAPRSGSYRGVSAIGLFWSQHLVRAGAAAAASPSVTTLTVSAGKRRLGSATVTQLLSGPRVTEHAETIAKTGFFGEYFAPPGRARGPAVIVWGGSEGALGASPWVAALFASHGIPSLALAYFDEPGLPCALSSIPLEYFVKAIRWLRSQPQVDPGRVWLEAASRGTEAELLVAAHWPALVHGVVAAVPSSVAYGTPPAQCGRPSSSSWTLNGRPLPVAPTTGAPMFNPDGSVSDRNVFLAGLAYPAAAAARIPIERLKGAVMLISGAEDQLWPSNVYADRIMAALRSDPARHIHLNYPGAGHGVFSFPFLPPVMRSASRPAP